MHQYFQINLVIISGREKKHAFRGNSGTFVDKDSLLLNMKIETQKKQGIRKK